MSLKKYSGKGSVDPRILYPAKLSFKYTGKGQLFTSKKSRKIVHKFLSQKADKLLPIKASIELR